jgi:hypothetical protein
MLQLERFYTTKTQSRHFGIRCNGNADPPSSGRTRFLWEFWEDAEIKSVLPIGGNLMEDQLSTAGVGFLGMLIIGIIAGWIAEKVTASGRRLAGQFVEYPIRWLARQSARVRGRRRCYGCGGS